jgi:IMP dehydrogenase
MISLKKKRFFDRMDELELALTFDDVRMRTRSGRHEPLPAEIDVTSKFSENVSLKVPFVSAAMDTVTGAEMAIALAKFGGLGVIHAAMPIEQQKITVQRVKMAINGLIDNPIYVKKSETLEQVLNRCEEHRFDFRTFPVVGENGKFMGILSGTDFRYPETMRTTVGKAMTPASQVVTAPVGTSLDEAYRAMQSKKISTLPLITKEGALAGMYLFSDVRRIYLESDHYNVDSNGRLRTAAAVSTGLDTLERVKTMRQYLDVVVIDTADGDSFYAFKTLEAIKSEFPDLDVVVGNISDGASARQLVEAGANGIKVGQGPGSICTTRRETGIGMPQVSAVYEAVKALGEEYAHIPVTADGGIKDHGDIPIAFAAGAHAVMMGRMLAGTAEAPGELIIGRDGSRMKLYRGMGSPSALQDNEASRERYGANTTGTILSEGVEARVPYEGNVDEILGRCLQALRKGMRYVKAPDLTTHREQTLFRRITSSGLRESHPHDINVVAQ